MEILYGRRGGRFRHGGSPPFPGPYEVLPPEGRDASIGGSDKRPKGSTGEEQLKRETSVRLGCMPLIALTQFQIFSDLSLSVEFPILYNSKPVSHLSC